MSCYWDEGMFLRRFLLCVLGGVSVYSCFVVAKNSGTKQINNFEIDSVGTTSFCVVFLSKGYDFVEEETVFAKIHKEV